MDIPVSNSSLKKRFGFKLGVNFVSVLFGLVLILVVPRTLGPENFGRFEFVTNNFRLLLDMLALQVPVAYFNWISRKGHKQDTDLATGATLYFSFAVMALFALVILAAVVFDFNPVLWPEIRPGYLALAGIFTAAMFLNQFFIYLADGKALTIGLEKIRLLQNFSKMAVVVVLIRAAALTLKSYFIAQCGVFIVSVLILFLWLRQMKALQFGIFNIRKFSREMLSEYYKFVLSYVRPLIFLMFSAFLFLYFDRWFLQLIGGSAQQGYFGLSDRLSSLAFIFTSAMTPLITREFAHAYEDNDMERMRGLFNRIKIFLFIATTMGCFLCVQSRTLITLVGGAAFKNAFLPIAIMALYPIHQTLGQLSAALLLATGRTKIYSTIGVSMMLLSLPLTYFLLAPAGFAVPGMGLGACGLAVKMVLVQIIGTNIQLYFNTKYLGLSFWKWLLLQAGSISLLLGVSFAVMKAVALAAGAYGLFSGFEVLGFSRELCGAAVNFILSGMIYLTAAGSIVVFFPSLIGCSSKELKELYIKALQFLRPARAA